MGLYLNPGNEEFRNAAIHSKIYVDKTEMIKFTNSQLFGEHKNICVSRPRRFGKSMAANMLVAYYSKGCDSKELFENFKIADDSSFKEHLNKYNVIHLNIQQFLGRTETIHEMLELLSRKVTRELKREFADVTYYEEDLVSVIEEIYAQTHSFFVFIIDEEIAFTVENGMLTVSMDTESMVFERVKDAPEKMEVQNPEETTGTPTDDTEVSGTDLPQQ